MPLKIEIPTLGEVWNKMGIKRVFTFVLTFASCAALYFLVYGFEKFWIVLLPLLLWILDKDDESWIRTIYVAADGKLKYVINICCSLVLFAFVLGFFIPLSADRIPVVRKSLYRLNQFSTYSTLDGVRLHNSCWLQIFGTNYDPAMLFDKDSDGFSQYCEAYDESYIVTNSPITTELNLRLFSDGWYILGMPIVWDNIQTSDPSKAVAGYEIIFRSVDVLTGEAKEQIESCQGKFDAMQRVFSCPPSQETVKWLTLNSLTPIYMTIRSYDSLGRRTPLLQERSLHLVI